MSGVSCVENDLQYSTNLYTTNLELALMGIQSTAQFVEKYHHIIGELLLYNNISIFIYGLILFTK